MSAPIPRRRQWGRLVHCAVLRRRAVVISERGVFKAKVDGEWLRHPRGYVMSWWSGKSAMRAAERALRGTP